MTKNIFVFFGLITCIIAAFTVSIGASTVSYIKATEISSINNAHNDVIQSE